MVQQKITDYFIDLSMNDSEEVPPPRNILINGNIHGSRSLLDNKMLYLESKYEPVMVTYEDSSMFVLCCLNMKSGEEVIVHYYQNFCRNRDTVWKIIREIQTAQYLDHPNILELESIGLPIISNTEEENCLKVAGRLFDDFYLVFKSAGFENLQNFLSTGQSIFNIPKMVYQVRNTLKYLHDSVGILHHGLSLRGNLLAKYEESSKNSNPTFLDVVRHSCPWAVGLVTKMLCFDPTKRISIDHAIEYVRTNQGIAEEDSEDKFNEYMEEEDAANTSEVMEEEGAVMEDRLFEDVRFWAM